MASETSSPIPYTGTFRHGIDPKNRITIPADWRSGEAEEFYLKVDSTQSCIHVMPRAEFFKLKDQYETYPAWSPQERQRMVRWFASASIKCNADKQGRMVLPPEYCTKVAFNADVVLAGASGRFEIWNAARWETAQAAEEAECCRKASELGL